MNDLEIARVGVGELYPGTNDVEFNIAFDNNGDTYDDIFVNASTGQADLISWTVNTTGPVTIDGSNTGVEDDIVYGTERRLSFTADVAGSPGDTVCFQLTVSPSDGFSHQADQRASGSLTEPNPPICYNLGESPYFEVHGADIWAGGAWDNSPDHSGGSWCPFAAPISRSDAFIKAVRTPFTHGVPGGGTSGIGASIDFAATAIARVRTGGGDGIYGVTTISETQGIPPIITDDTRLAFANQGGSTPGNYNTQGRCIIDYYDYLSKDAADGVLPHTGSNLSGISGQYYHNGNLTINSAQSVAGQKIYLVNGDVTINRNITLNYGSVNDTNDIPFLMIIANGDINIGRDVTTLDGVFVAKDPNTGNGVVEGVIDTCHNPVTNAAGDLKLDSCPIQLTIHGMFIAHDVQFRRTYKGIIQNDPELPNEGSELFQFSPEIYLAQPAFISEFEKNLPASQVKDLPPTY
jgi:hypothetical protein